MSWIYGLLVLDTSREMFATDKRLRGCCSPDEALRNPGVVSIRVLYSRDYDSRDYAKLHPGLES
jgi:hypothetical protein